MVQDMSARRIKDYAFDWSRMLSFEGDTGPYLQYAHARLYSLIQRALPLNVTPEIFDTIQLELLDGKQAETLIDVIAQFPDIVAEAGLNKEPTTVVKYCLRLSHAVSSAVTDLYVFNQPQDVALARLAMYQAAQITLANGLSLLGLKPLNRM